MPMSRPAAPRPSRPVHDNNPAPRTMTGHAAHPVRRPPAWIGCGRLGRHRTVARMAGRVPLPSVIRAVAEAMTTKARTSDEACRGVRGICSRVELRVVIRSRWQYFCTQKANAMHAGKAYMIVYVG